MANPPENPSRYPPWPPRIAIDGEPDPRSGTLEEWRTYREKLAALPPKDETVRLAIAVADAQIERLKRKH